MGWELFNWSFTVIRQNKRLMLFPICSGIASLAGLFLCYVGWQATGHGVFHRPGPQDLTWIAPGYFLITFLVIFFNSALAACAQAQLSGREATFGYGISEAANRFLSILGWALLATTVGLLLQLIERRVSWAGKIAVWLFGFAWSLATFLVIPVLVAEDCGPMEAVRRSASLVRDTWGDQLVAQIRFGWRGLVFFLPCILLGVAGANGYPILLPLAVACFALASIVLSAARGVFEVALYRYAATGETPAGWMPDTLPGIFTRPGNNRTLNI